MTETASKALGKDKIFKKIEETSKEIIKKKKKK